MKSVRRKQAACCCLAVCCGALPPAFANDWKVTPTVSVGATLSDNINLSPDKEGDLVLTISPGVSVRKETGRLRLNADYSFQNVVSFSDSDRNNSFHQLSAGASAEVWADRLFVDARASISQANISPFGLIGLDNTSNSDNRTTVKSFDITGRYVQRFGSFATGQARYTHGESHYTDAFSTRTNDAVSLNLDSGSRFNTVGWGLAYSHSNTDSETVDWSAESVSGYLSFIYSPRLRFRLTGGYEDFNVPTTANVPEGEFWSVGVDYAPGPLTTLNASFGRRFFGDTKSFSLTRKGRHSNWLVNYSENVVNEEVVLPILRAFVLTDLAGNPLPNPLTGQPFTFFRLERARFSETFLTKGFDTSYSYDFGRSKLTLSAYDRERDSQLRALIIEERGANGLWNWRVFPRTSADFGLGFQRANLKPLGREDKYIFLTVGATHKLSAKATATLTYRHQRRDSNMDPDYNENSLALFVNMRF